METCNLGTDSKWRPVTWTVTQELITNGDLQLRNLFQMETCNLGTDYKWRPVTQTVTQELITNGDL